MGLIYMKNTNGYSDIFYWNHADTVQLKNEEELKIIWDCNKRLKTNVTFQKINE